jgi:DNA-binding transcriptional MerR regulator
MASKINLIFCLAMLCVLISVCMAGPKGGRGGRRQFSDEDVKKIKEKCKEKGVNCKGQDESKKAKRQMVKDTLKDAGMDEDTIERQFQKMLEAKRAMNKAEGLDDVIDPADDGTIFGDLTLNEQQSQYYIDLMNGLFDNATVESPIPSTIGRSKRGVFLQIDTYNANKWPSTTINYYVDPAKFTDAEKKIIKDGMDSIAAVSCFKFNPSNVDPKMTFVKYSTTSGNCGFAGLGYQGDGKPNNININFNTQSPCWKTIQGTVVHEALHSIGFMHEHQRYDQSSYLYLNNVDPQQSDVYKPGEPDVFSPFCIPYDYLSIMHYGVYVGALDRTKPAVVPVTDAANLILQIGTGNTMTASDAKLLNKMYCDAGATSGCVDVYDNCGWDACGDCGQYSSVCPKSCNACPTS